MKEITRKNASPMFERYIGIDYSGASTADARLQGLSVYVCSHNSIPEEIRPPKKSAKNWSRLEIGHWLVSQLSLPQPCLVGIDHGFSFPLAYFQENQVEQEWQKFLDHFCSYWPLDEAGVKVDDIRRNAKGIDQKLLGNNRWKRLAEQRTKQAKSVFLFDVNGSVAKSTYSGLPWLRNLRQQMGSRLHCWPFDGWEIPAGKSALVEIYPALWNKDFPREGRNSHQHDAFSSASWLLQRDFDGSLANYLRPSLTKEEQRLAQFEGWILGVE